MIDAGRIKNSIDTFNAQYQAILSDPDSFNNYVYNARQSAADIASKRKYQAMNNIQDYATFAREMDKMYNESSFREQSLITRAFRDKDNVNFERYSQERQMLQDLIEQVSSSDNHKNMSDNDKEMFAHTITYLSDKGIDFNDLYQEGLIGLIGAVDSFKEQKDIKFSTFAFLCIKRKILTAVKNANRKKHSILNESYSLDYTMEDDIRSFDNFLTTSKGGLEDLLVSKEDNDYFNKRLSEELTDFERTVYDLRINNFGYDEIANTLGKTPKAIERTLVRIRSKLTNILKEIN